MVRFTCPCGEWYEKKSDAKRHIAAKNQCRGWKEYPCLSIADFERTTSRKERLRQKEREAADTEKRVREQELESLRKRIEQLETKTDTSVGIPAYTSRPHIVVHRAFIASFETAAVRLIALYMKQRFPDVHVQTEVIVHKPFGRGRIDMRIIRDTRNFTYSSQLVEYAWALKPIHAYKNTFQVDSYNFYAQQEKLPLPSSMISGDWKETKQLQPGIQYLFTCEENYDPSSWPKPMMSRIVEGFQVTDTRKYVFFPPMVFVRFKNSRAVSHIDIVTGLDADLHPITETLIRVHGNVDLSRVFENVFVKHDITLIDADESVVVEDDDENDAFLNMQLQGLSHFDTRIDNVAVPAYTRLPSQLTM